MAGNRYCCTMRRSVNRERIDVTEIGLNSPKVLGLAVFGTGVTIACFHGFGGLPSRMLLLIMFAITGVSWRAQCLNSQYGIPSGPAAVLF